MEMPATKSREAINKTKWSGLMLPAIRSLVASTTFSTGIQAVTAFSSIPGIIPTMAGVITRKFKGVRMLWASLKDLA